MFGLILFYQLLCQLLSQPTSHSGRNQSRIESKKVFTCRQSTRIPDRVVSCSCPDILSIQSPDKSIQFVFPRFCDILLYLLPEKFQIFSHQILLHWYNSFRCRFRISLIRGYTESVQAERGFIFFYLFQIIVDIFQILIRYGIQLQILIQSECFYPKNQIPELRHRRDRAFAFLIIVFRYATFQIPQFRI